MLVHSLHLITDRHPALLDAVAAALAGGVDWIQVRAKSAPALEVWEIASAAAELTRRRGAGLIVNDRVDVAVAVGADGVHLGKKSMPPRAARLVIGPCGLIGQSVHSEVEAVEAAAAGVDYVTFGHIFPTPSKPGLPPRGVEALRRVVSAVDIPVLAIGGITPERVPAVLETGCAGIAVIGAVLSADDPEAAARRLREAMDAVTTQPRKAFPRHTLEPRV